MKIAKISLLAFVFILGITVGCKQSFLDILPTGALDETKLTTSAGLQGSLIGAYSYLLGRSGDFYDGVDDWFWGNVLGGEAYKGSNAGDQAQVNEIASYSPQPNNASVLEKYAACYEGVARCNNTLKLLANAAPEVSDAEKTEIEAETKFLRALYYFELKIYFNNTPYVDETWDGVTPVKNDQDLWQFIEADLKTAMKDLPSTQADVGRANKYAAEALLAKAYLFEGKNSDAQPLFTDLLTNGETSNGLKYGLLPNYSDVFRPQHENSQESVFAVQSAVGTGTVSNANPDMVLNFPYSGSGDVAGNCCGFDQPSLDFVNSFRTVNGLPLLDGSYDNATNAIKNDDGLTSDQPFTPDTGPIDPRLDWSVGRRGIPYLDWGPFKGALWIRDQTNGGPYAPKKFIYMKADAQTEVDNSGWTPGYVAQNYDYIRYADVLLMAAENDAQMNDLTNAQKLVNMVRARAANPADFVMDSNGNPAANYVINQYTTPWPDKATAMSAIEMERKLELGQEGHRFPDLVRWGIAATVLNNLIAYNNKNMLASPYIGATFKKGKSEYLPIPQTEIDIAGAGVITQNPGY